MQIMHVSDNEVVSTPIYAGSAPIPPACAEAEHDWQPLGSGNTEPVAHNGFLMSMEQCSKCRRSRLHGYRKLE